MFQAIFDVYSIDVKTLFEYRLLNLIELLSRAASSVGVCTIPGVSTQGEIPDEGRYLKKIKIKVDYILLNVI